MSIQKLTLGEVETIEDILGKSLGEIVQLGTSMPAKAIGAFAFVVRRRTDPDVTLEQVRADDFQTNCELIRDVVGGDDDAPKAKTTVTHAGRVTQSSRAKT